MKIDILTLFPEMFQGPFDASIIKRARERELIGINILNIRDFSKDKHHNVDDLPYGGGAGMVMRPEPVYDAVEYAGNVSGSTSRRVIFLCPTGMPFTQEMAKDFSREEHLVLVCGHYEGFDERVVEELATDEVSIGDFVLTGGELPAMVIVDALARLIPGVLGEESSAREDSFYDGILEYPHYTRPRNFRGVEVPEVLTSGHHEKIRRWRRMHSLLSTLIRRPELLSGDTLTGEDMEMLREIKERVNTVV